MADHQRYLALDVFRGMTVCFMIIVNSPGDWSHVYSPLLHADWHGFTPTDLVFPSFLFAVGNAMAFAMHKYELQGDGVFWKKTMKRTLLIFLIGYLMSWFPFVREVDGAFQFKPFETTRILGVLQRIALCYLIASVIIHYCSKKVAAVMSVLLLLGYWLIMYVAGDSNDPYSLTGNAALKLDLFIMGANHLYHGEGVAFDPEGILSTLPAIVNVIVGYFAGDFIRKHGNSYETVAKLLIAGVTLVFLALTWNMVFPINKKIWTSSFTLITVGLDLIILPVLIYVIEILKRKTWTSFFTVFGKNPLFIYVLSEVLIITMYMIPIGDSNLFNWIAKDLLGSIASPINASLLFALLFMLVNWSVGYILDKNKIYIKV
jgi:predicted acyltransferase